MDVGTKQLRHVFTNEIVFLVTESTNNPLLSSLTAPDARFEC